MGLIWDQTALESICDNALAAAQGAKDTLLFQQELIDD